VTRFDFDRLSKLAKSDPAAFEREADALQREVIDNAPESVRKRLEAQQWALTQRLNKRKTPDARMSLMVVELFAALDKLRKVLTSSHFRG
jgi:hypothetical protein